MSAVSSVLVFVLPSGFCSHARAHLVFKAPSAHPSVPVLCLAKEAGQSCLCLPLAEEQMVLEEVEQLHPHLSPGRGWRVQVQSGREMELPLERILQHMLQHQTFVWSSKERPKPFWRSLELQCGSGKVCCSSSVPTATRFCWAWLCCLGFECSRGVVHLHKPAGRCSCLWHSPITWFVSGAQNTTAGWQTQGQAPCL